MGSEMCIRDRTGTVNYFWDMMAELVKPEDLQILKERAEAIVEGGADK